MHHSSPPEPAHRNDSASPRGDKPSGPAQSAGRRLTAHLLELIELQVRLAALKVLAAVQASFFKLGLLLTAFLAALAAIVFLYISIFQELNRLMPSRDVFLLFALFHFLICIGLVLAARRITDAGAPARKTTGRRPPPAPTGDDT